MLVNLSKRSAIVRIMRIRARVWRHSWRDAVQHVVAWAIASRASRAVTCSLVLHLSFAVWATLSLLHGDSRQHEVALLTDWSELPAGAPVEISADISPIRIESEGVTQGGSSGTGIMAALAPEPTVSNPLENTLSEAGLGSIVAANDNLLAAVAKGTGQTNGLGQGRGRGIGNGVGDGTQFFGLPTDAKSFVYVLDCSLSMNHPHDSDAKTRFNRMKLELIQSVAHLKPEQEFFIVFFNHDAIPMPAERPVAAVPENQRQFLSWMQQVEARGDTDPTAAMQIALRLRPDVIYFLTDGCFSREANDIIRSIAQTHTVIHTFSFEPPLTEKQREGLELLRKKKASAALLKLGEGTFRRTREVFVAEQVMQDLASRNGGKYHVIR